MKNHEDLARGWWRKGDSDLENARMCVEAERSLDTACFHAQQAAEKYLKAYLSLKKIEFPFMHNLASRRRRVHRRPFAVQSSDLAQQC
jgi:HEPN domain-containing protein